MYYEIEGTKVRLAGSMHAIPEGCGPLPEWVAKGYRCSEELYLEGDASELLPYMQAPAARGVQQALSDRAWRELSSKWSGPTHQKLWVVLTQFPRFALRFEEGTGVESVLQARCRDDGRTVRYLETAQEANALVGAVPEKVYAALIESLIFDLDSLASTFLELYGAWRYSDIEKFERLIPRLHLAQEPIVRKAFLDDRNSAWLPKILETIAIERRALIVVGAAHLFGSDGLLALLEKSGHRLKRLA